MLLTKKLTSLLIFCLIFFTTVKSYSKIYKRVDSDGNIEFYTKKNVKKWKKSKFKTKHTPLITRISRKHGIDPYLIKCIIKVESNFNENAVSIAGAMGLMQLMQSTAEYYNMTDLFDPEENLDAGIRHFKSLMKYFKNNIPLSLAAYHAGLGRVKKRMKIPPIKSTINYVKKIIYLYNGNKTDEKSVKKLYIRIDHEGDFIIYSK